MRPFVRAAGRCLASVKNPWTRNIDIAGAAIGSWPHTRTSPSSSRNNPRPRSFSCPSTAIIHQTTARFEPRRGAAIAAAFAAITTSSTSKITPHSACPASIKKKGKKTQEKWRQCQNNSGERGGKEGSIEGGRVSAGEESEEAIRQENVEVEATARGRTWTEATETTHKRSQDRQPAAWAAAIVIGGGDA